MDGDGNTYTGVEAKPEGVAVEMVDCLIRILDTLQSLNLDSTLELVMFGEDLIHVWQFDEAAFLLERAAASLCEADGTPWARAQAEDKERWRKIAKAVKLAPADSDAWPSEYHPLPEETR